MVMPLFDDPFVQVHWGVGTGSSETDNEFLGIVDIEKQGSDFAPLDRWLISAT